MHKLFGRHWEELPAKYKLVVATALAFVLCNMVGFVANLAHVFFLLSEISTELHHEHDGLLICLSQDEATSSLALQMQAGIKHALSSNDFLFWPESFYT